MIPYKKTKLLQISFSDKYPHTSYLMIYGNKTTSTGYVVEDVTSNPLLKIVRDQHEFKKAEDFVRELFRVKIAGSTNPPFLNIWELCDSLQYAIKEHHE